MITDNILRKNLKEMGRRIKKIRDELRITQKKMTSVLKMSACSLSEIETGKGNPGFAFFFKISTRYNVNLEYLFHGTGEMFKRSKLKNNQNEYEYKSEIETIDDLYWYLENSSLLRAQVIGFAAKFKCDNEEIIKKNVKRNIEKKR